MGIENNLEPDAGEQDERQTSVCRKTLSSSDLAQNVALEWCCMSKPLAPIGTEGNTNTNQI